MKRKYRSEIVTVTTGMKTVQRCESLVNFAKIAGILVPDDLYDSSGNFPHWDLFCKIQIDRPVASIDAISHNAEVIAAISSERLKSSEPFKFEEISHLLK